MGGGWAALIPFRVGYRLTDFLSRLSQTHITAAGVAVVDFIMMVDAFPRKAEKYRAKDSAIVGGGCAANAAVAIARLGGQAHLCARLGLDSIGDMIIADLQAEGVNCENIKRFEGCRSSYSNVLLDAEGERQIVNFRDMNISFDADWLQPEKSQAFLGDTRWPQGAAALMKAAKAAGVPGVMDAEAPVMEAEEAILEASHIAFSMQGLREFAYQPDIATMLRSAHKSTHAWTCVTDGANGVYWLENGTLRHRPAFNVDVVDTLGAGDVWHGAFALALGAGAGEEQAIEFASATAALKCTQMGGRAGAPNLADVIEFLKENAGW